MKSRIFLLFQKSKTICPIPKKFSYDKDRGMYFYLEPIISGADKVSQPELILKNNEMVVFTLKDRR